MENEIAKVEGYDNITETVSKKMNFFQRLIGIIISPNETTKNLIQKPRILFPIILFLLAPIIGIFAGWTAIESYLRQSMDTAIAKNQSIEFTPEMIDSMMSMYKVMFPIIIVIVLFLFWIVGTAIFYGFLKLFKGEGRFKQYLSITGYSSVILLISTILTYGTFLLSGTMLDLSPAVLLPDPSGSFALGFVKGILGALNILSLWYLWVTCIGFKNASNLSKRKVYSIVIGLYAVLSILSALLAGYGTAIM